MFFPNIVVSQVLLYYSLKILFSVLASSKTESKKISFPSFGISQLLFQYICQLYQRSYKKPTSKPPSRLLLHYLWFLIVLGKQGMACIFRLNGTITHMYKILTQRGNTILRGMQVQLF